MEFRRWAYFDELDPYDLRMTNTIKFEHCSQHPDPKLTSPIYYYWLKDLPILGRFQTTLGTPDFVITLPPAFMMRDFSMLHSGL